MSGARALGNALRRAGRSKVCGEEVQRAVVGGCESAFGSFEINSVKRRQWLVGRDDKTFSYVRAIHTSYASPSWRTESAQGSTHTHDPKDQLPEQLRGVMRRLAHSVVVCTATDRDGRPRGMTMSSFVSLSMDPSPPLVTFNVRTPSRTLTAIGDQEGRFNIHVLAEGVKGARVAEWFTRGNVGSEVFHDLPGEIGVVVENENGEAPVLEGCGVLFVLKCRVLGEGMVRVRDHVVVVGEVEEVVRGKGEGFGLVYADRRYRTLGEVLVKEEE